MIAAAYVLVQCLFLFLCAVDVAMLARMIVNLLFFGEPTRIGSFLYVITEPVILPIRALCRRLGWFQGTPMDMPFFLTSVIIMLVTTILSSALGV